MVPLLNINLESLTYDTEIENIRIYKPISLYRKGTRTGARGSVQISKFYYDGSHIIMDAFIYAHNPTNNPEAKDPDDNPLRVAPWFRTNEYNGPKGAEIHPEHRNTKETETIQVGKGSQYYYPGPLTDPDPVTGERRPFHRFVGDLAGRKLYFGAHAHLQVSTTTGNVKVDDWEVDTKHQTLL